MFIKISTGKETKPVEVSKAQLIKDLKELIQENFNIDVARQRLFFSGKLLDDNTPIYKYDVKDGYVIQVIECAPAPAAPEEPKTEKPVKEKKIKGVQEQTLSEYYKLGDFLEVQDEDGSWYEGEITEMYQEVDKENTDGNIEKEPEIVYKIYYKKDGKDIEKEIKLDQCRPRSIHSFDVNNLKIRQTFHVNYNINNPNAWGKWYDFFVEEIDRRRRVTAIGKILLGGDKSQADVKLELNNFDGSIFGIRKHIKISERDKNFDVGAKPIFCDRCKKNRTMKCKDCGCSVCGGREEPEKTIVCDECQLGFHIFCLKPVLKEIPEEDDWYCKDCINQDEIVKAGETIKTKRGSTADKTKSNRDWGRGMATAGRRTTNTIVSETHFGSIPGVEVGTMWRYRIQVAESGIHRPHVAGIAGRKDVGAFSIVLGGGYEDDKDDGDEVIYTGSGGRDLTGNKRVSGQSCDQELTRMNLSLAKNCNAPINNKEGSESKDWKKGKPVRVVRSYKEKSIYAPPEGFRYDGLYKIVKYFPKTGKSGFKVWQFLLRRDDPTPAPWTDEGKKHIEAHGLEDVIYPENYVEKDAKAKRKSDDSDDETPVPKKKKKIVAFDLGELKKEIEEDELNSGKWEEVNEFLKEGKVRYLEELTKVFECICCQNLIHKPVTTPCKHNFCNTCFKNARKVMGKVCPLCKGEIKEDVKINANLEKVLLSLYPGYEVGR